MHFTLIFVAVLLIILLVYINNISDKKNHKTKSNHKHNKHKPMIEDTELLNDVINWDNSSNIVTKEILNNNFLNIQFHNDYRDVITAINNLVPEKRQRFNLANIPIVYSEPESVEVKKLIKDFIIILNENLKSEVPILRNPSSGWDEAIPDPRIESGWDKVQKSLGLPNSIYENSAKNDLVKLIGINYVQKYETEDEIKYVIELVIQKINITDQMIIKSSFVQDKRLLNDENNFFVNSKIEMRIIIEDVFIVGYLSNKGPDSKQQYDSDKEKFYDYNTLEHNNMTSPKYIQKILMDKYKQRTEEMDQRNALLDEEGRGFHRTLPHMYDFSNFQGTRTIFNDMNDKKILY